MEFVKNLKIFKKESMESINEEIEKLRKEDEGFNSHIEKTEDIHFHKLSSLVIYV